MTIAELRRAIARANLTHLAAKSGINVRTLRRIRSGETCVVLSSTIAAITRGLRK